MDRYARYRRLVLERPEEGILRIVFDRPETLNSIDAETHHELTGIWRDVEADPEVAVTIVTGRGRAFSAGGDFDWVERIAADPRERVRAWKEARDLVHRMVDNTKPVVSAINGPAAGAGLVVGLLADVSIAARSAKIVDGHTRLGVAAGDVAVLIWPLLCGLAKAKYHLLLCEPLTGEEAERIGLVSLCVDDERVQETALDVARRLRDGAPCAIRWTKYALDSWLRQALPLFDLSTALEMLGFAGEEVKEGLASWREKRPPRFPRDCPF